MSGSRRGGPASTVAPSGSRPPPDPAVDELLARLTPTQERAVRLVYVQGRTYAEAARLLDTPGVLVARAVADAFRHLARWLTDPRQESAPGEKR